MSKVFVMTNQASGNQVWVYDRSGSGVLTPPPETFMFPTGGTGIGGPASTADPLLSQGSLAMTPDHQLIFAANAGSNDVTSFRVGADGTLTPADRVGSGGLRPVSIAVSGSRDVVYVLNAGDPSGGVTACSSIVGLRLGAEGRLTFLRGATRPTSGTASEIRYTPDGNHLVVVNRTASTIDVFPVNTDGTLGGIRTRSATARAPFAGSFIGRDDAGRDVLAVTGLSATNMLGLYGIDAVGTTEPIGAPMTITGAAGSCWTVLDNPGQPNFLYVSSAVSSTIDAFTVNRPPGGTASLTPSGDGPAARLTPQNPDGSLPDDALGATDMAVTSDSQFLYVIAGTENATDRNNQPIPPTWEVRGYRMNGTKLGDAITSVSPPVGTQGIVAS